jgi:hypothetical protein
LNIISMNSHKTSETKTIQGNSNTRIAIMWSHYQSVINGSISLFITVKSTLTQKQKVYLSNTHTTEEMKTNIWR